MERSLLWAACGLGCVGFLCGPALLHARSGAVAEETEPAVRRSLVLLAAALPILIFLATLPSHRPFAAGQGWGRGFLLGGLGALLAGWAVLRARQGDSALSRAALVATPCWVAVAVVAASLIFGGRDTVLDRLLGIAMGWFAVSFTLCLAAEDSGVRHLLPLASGIGFAVTLCSVAALGVYRDALSPELETGTWGALAVTLGAGVPLALVVGGALPLSGRGVMLRAVSALAVLAALAALLSLKVLAEGKPFIVVCLGLALGLLAWWLVREAGTRSDDAASFPMPPLTLALVLGGFMAAYQMLHGFGVGVMLLSAWLPAVLALSSQGRLRASAQVLRTSTDGTEREGESASLVGPDLTRLLLVGTVLLLYRLVTTRFAGDLRGVSLTDHYALFGFLIGAVLPGLLAGLLRVSPVRLLLTGAAALAAPGVVLLLWGGKCALALLAGLALGAAGAFEARRGRSSAVSALFPALLAVAVALALAQWTGHVLPLAEMTRAVKIRVLVGIFAGLLALVAVSDVGGRLRGRGAVSEGSLR